MAGEEDRDAEILAAMDTTTVTRGDLNEAMASLKSSMMVEVKSTLKEFLESLKPSTDPIQVVNPTLLDTDATSA
jgi:hypothetical protein